MSSPSGDGFESVSDPALREIASLGVIRKATKGTRVFREGDVGDTVGVISEGRVEIFLADEGKAKFVLAVRETGECFGDMSLGVGQRRSASVVCLTPCVFSIVTRETLMAAMQDKPEIALFIISTLIQRTRSGRSPHSTPLIRSSNPRKSHSCRAISRQPHSSCIRAAT